MTSLQLVPLRIYPGPHLPTLGIDNELKFKLSPCGAGGGKEIPERFKVS